MNQSFRKIFFVVSIIFLILISYFNFSKVNQKINSISSYFLYPVVIIYNKTVKPIISFIEQCKSTQQLVTQLALLIDEKNKLLAQAITVENSLDYIKNNKELRTYSKKFNSEGILAQILSVHYTQKGHYMLIDKGSNHHIELDMVAVAYNNLLGRITEVYPWYSKLLLITDTQSKVAVYGAKSKSKGIHEGVNNENYTFINFVTLLKPLQVGELVLSSGEGMIFPRGFLLGKISHVNKGSIYQQVTVEPLIQIRDLTFCLLISKKNM